MTKTQGWIDRTRDRHDERNREADCGGSIPGDLATTVNAAKPRKNHLKMIERMVMLSLFRIWERRKSVVYCLEDDGPWSAGMVNATETMPIVPFHRKIPQAGLAYFIHVRRSLPEIVPSHQRPDKLEDDADGVDCPNPRYCKSGGWAPSSKGR